MTKTEQLRGKLSWPRVALYPFTLATMGFLYGVTWQSGLLAGCIAVMGWDYCYRK